jgi:hypothetical protein
MKHIILFLLFISSQIYAAELSDTFIVKIFHDKVKVISPAKLSNNLTVIVENKTLVDIRGKIETKLGKVVAYVTIPSGQSKSVPVKISKKDKIYFVPMAPAFQAVELIVGRKAYEIPPKR